MKWGQAARRPKKPWHSDVTAGADGASPSKPWLQDAAPKPSVASILGALSFEGGEGQDDNVMVKKNSSPIVANSDANKVDNSDSNEWESIEQQNVNTGGDNKSQQGDSVTEDCTESETALETPLSQEDPDNSATAATGTVNMEQPLSPSGSVYYNAEETEGEVGKMPAVET